MVWLCTAMGYCQVLRIKGYKPFLVRLEETHYNIRRNEMIGACPLEIPRQIWDQKL